MPTARTRLLVNHLRRAALLRDRDGVSDGQLLADFVARRDPEAFAALVRRHGPMVMAVCRRVLLNHHDAEDAFQATFLVFARKARTIRSRDVLAGWLYRVAYRVAQVARARAARRKAKELQVTNFPDPPTEPTESWADYVPLLDRELDRLPDKYRLPVILCELEGRGRREVARQLGVPEGTLSSRLATARKMLARRFSQRGLTLSLAGATTLLTKGAASAGVPVALVSSTTKAAVVFAAGQAVTLASTQAIALTEGVLKSMFISKLKTVAVAFLVVIGLGGGGLAYRSGLVQAAGPEKQVTARPQSELEALRKENELLRLNLQLVLEKVRAQEAELRSLRSPRQAVNVKAVDGLALDVVMPRSTGEAQLDFVTSAADVVFSSDAVNIVVDPTRDAEVAIKALREAKDPKTKRKAAEALDRALRKLSQQLK